MPCSDGGTDEASYRHGYDQGLREGRQLALEDSDVYKEGIKDGRSHEKALHDDNTPLLEREAMFCAVLGTLKSISAFPSEEGFEDMILQAEIDGQIPGILDWWKKHETEDSLRLKNATHHFLKNFSDQEQEIIGTFFRKD